MGFLPASLTQLMVPLTPIYRRFGVRSILLRNKELNFFDSGNPPSHLAVDFLSIFASLPVIKYGRSVKKHVKIVNVYLLFNYFSPEKGWECVHCTLTECTDPLPSTWWCCWCFLDDLLQPPGQGLDHGLQVLGVKS